MKIAVMMGGISDERSVSLRSGATVLSHLMARGFDVRPLIVEADRSFSLGKPVANEAQAREFAEEPRLAAGFPLFEMRSDALRITRRLIEWGTDLVFIALHGPGGEDGAMQGFLEWSGLRYTGAGVGASALAMNKCAFKALLVDQDLPTAPHLTFTADEWRAGRAGVLGRGIAGPGLPGVIKVSGSGSSYGVYMVRSRAELEPALDRAFAADTHVLWESFIPGTELTCALLGDFRQPEIRSFPIVEIVPRKADFFDYESKYSDGGADEIVPARIPESAAEEMQRISLRIHRLIGCRGMSRTDAILDPQGRLFVLETNTIPGLTPASLFPKAAAGAGFSFGAFVEMLVRDALDDSEREADGNAG